MGIQDYWNALGRRQRIGLSIGIGLILLLTIALCAWVLRDPLVPLASGLPPERQAALAQELDRIKIDYRVAEDGNSLLVPSSMVGKARAALGSGGLGLPPAAGLELFKEADFSTTDFAQRINYQRALQGELTRTLQTISGVRNARVHVILAEGGLLKRNSTKASVAVTLQLQAGKSLSRAQVHGIQRLVAASVPEVQAGDVVVLDEAGNTLSRSSADAEGEASGAQLDMKRQVDGYVEAKLSRLLTDLAPNAQVTLSVDTALDFKQIKVTTEEPVAASGQSGDHPTGVVTRERQSQRPGREASAAKGDDGGSESSDWEYEYQVGKRIEQSLSTPGAVKRLSVAVAMHGAPESINSAMVEKLVEHAAGLDRGRGDSVAVVLLPAMQTFPVASTPAEAATLLPSNARQTSDHGTGPAAPDIYHTMKATVLLGLLLALVLGGTLYLVWMRKGPAPVSPASPVDIEAATAQVRAWLRNDGPVK